MSSAVIVRWACMGWTTSYRTVLSDARWALIEPVLVQWREARPSLGIRPPVHDLPEIVNAMYVARTGKAWEYLPHDFPPAKTFYDYYAKWVRDGTTARIHDLLRSRVREALGRDAEPSAAVLDAQSVKASCNVRESEQGIDAAKKIKGLLTMLAAEHPAVSKVWVDGATRTPSYATAPGGINVEVVPRSSAKGSMFCRGDGSSREPWAS